MRQYETTFILRPNLGEDQFTEIIDRTCGIITDDGGVIIDVDRWGIKRLAYEIKKESMGYYVCLNYAAPGTTIEEVERIFRIDDRLLRFLTIKLADEIDTDGIEKEKEAFASRDMEAEPEGAEETTESEPAAASTTADEAEEEEKPAEKDEQPSDDK
jgi:small subunit ribosomal protein S6